MFTPPWASWIKVLIDWYFFRSFRQGLGVDRPSSSRRREMAKSYHTLGFYYRVGSHHGKKESLGFSWKCHVKIDQGPSKGGLTKLETMEMCVASANTQALVVSWWTTWRVKSWVKMAARPWPYNAELRRFHISRKSDVERSDLSKKYLFSDCFVLLHLSIHHLDDGILEY